MTTRRRAREVVLQVLYEDELNPTREHSAAYTFLSSRLLDHSALVSFARSLLDGVRLHRFFLDQLIGKASVNWSVKRMAPVDRNILRLATFEIVHLQCPGPVAINEAVDLAKRYGDKNSGPFVNGVLDRLHKSVNLQNPSISPDNEERATSESQSDSPEKIAFGLPANSQ